MPPGCFAPQDSECPPRRESGWCFAKVMPWLNLVDGKRLAVAEGRQRICPVSSPRLVRSAAAGSCGWRRGFAAAGTWPLHGLAGDGEGRDSGRKGVSRSR
jgi:hypothetical protein